MQVLIFCALGLKMCIHAPKMGLIGGIQPQYGQQYQRDPQKAIPWMETRHV